MAKWQVQAATLKYSIGFERGIKGNKLCKLLCSPLHPGCHPNGGCIVIVLQNYCMCCTCMPATRSQSNARNCRYTGYSSLTIDRNSVRTTRKQCFCMFELGQKDWITLAVTCSHQALKKCGNFVCPQLICGQSCDIPQLVPIHLWKKKKGRVNASLSSKVVDTDWNNTDLHSVYTPHQIRCVLYVRYGLRGRVVGISCPAIARWKKSIRTWTELRI
jgi:hypothetical protein